MSGEGSGGPYIAVGRFRFREPVAQGIEQRVPVQNGLSMGNTGKVEASQRSDRLIEQKSGPGRIRTSDTRHWKPSRGYRGSTAGLTLRCHPITTIGPSNPEKSRFAREGFTISIVPVQLSPSPGKYTEDRPGGAGTLDYLRYLGTCLHILSNMQKEAVKPTKDPTY